MLLAAGCGGGGEEPGLPSELAEQLAARSDSTAARIESGDFCDARVDAAFVQKRAIEAINAGQVPAELQEELLGSANALFEAIGCTPPEADDRAEADARALADWLRENSG